MKIVLGTMNFGPQLDLEQSRAMVNEYLRSPFDELDTAYVYNSGTTEEFLGLILPELEEGSFRVATKVHPRITGRLDRQAIDMQLSESLRRMRRDSVDLLYFHFPDHDTPVEDALERVAELHEQGVVKHLGLSNYPAWKVADVVRLCDKTGCPRPTVYQGMYNALCRNVEPELFDALRHYGMSFYAFNPLAGGLLTGKHADYSQAPQEGRFQRLESYRKRYWKESYFEALDIIRQECEKEGIPPVEAAYRWLCCHSMLNAAKGDAIILGASRIEQMRQNVEATAKGPLPQAITSAYDAAWEVAKPDSPAYFKFFNVS